MPVATAHAGPPSYVYDDNGRLIAVTDPSSSTAIYTYDAVGNLLAITPRSSALLSILQFTPKRGPVGAKVTIFGTRFSTTPSQNTVRFKGIAAQVLSSSATQIVTTVPTGAITGPVSVTVGTGTATSVVPFTVVAGVAGSAPRITGFTPPVGAPGDAVSITGANFDPAPTSNHVTFNNTARGTVAAATTTTLRAIVPPSGTSGRISVITAIGKAVSTKDFFVAPPPYTAADVAFVGRMAIGQTLTVPINTANKIALVLFQINFAT